MSLGIAVRVGIGITVGGAAVAALARGLGVATNDAAVASAAVTDADDGLVLQWVTVPESWRGEAARIVLRLDAGHGTAAPVAEILASGRVVLRRPPPPPDGPLPEPWAEAGVQLPARLADLGPEARSAFLSLCAAWSGGKGMTASRLESAGFAMDPEAVRHLLRWQR